MYSVTDDTIKWSYKPYDLVENLDDGSIGFIQEVNINECQVTPNEQISYAVEWMIGPCTKHAWFKHDELKKHCNIFQKIAEASCHGAGGGAYKVKRFFNLMESNENKEATDA